MKKGDFIWGAILLLAVFIIISPFTKDAFIAFTTSYPYLGGFLKFALLATMGEMLAVRIRSGKWVKLSGLGYRAFIWGFIGVVITLIFVIFATGVEGAMEKNYLPGLHSPFLSAFFISTIMNIIFAPTMMGFHKLTDSYIDLKFGQKTKVVKLEQVINHVDWYGFIHFVLFKTIPLFWIPAHTITFLLPPEYRVVVAALLSVALGILLAIPKKK
ncbi:hypothetical protein [Vallitalea okinawensis]|uniref:hypothetical protein n=1 Tax=Vallitalea okinawensis TaxID=2078660 RepID=UPI000CFB86A8|nr:hypothetical protein [Vallitalea okinawensis]